MRFELELQFADFHPDQVDKVGPVDLKQALKVIHSYPWNREFEKIGERTKENLTSTVPNVSLRNRDNEILIVSARDNDNFIIELLTPTHRGELILANNAFERKAGFAIDDIVTKFYDNAIKDTLNLSPLRPTAPDNIKVYRLSDYPIFISVLTTGLLVLILIFNFWSNGFSEKALPAIYFVGVVILSMGLSALVTLQFLLTDWGKEVSFGQNGELTIRQKGKETIIRKSDIDEIVIVENDNHRTLRYYKYARIRTKGDRVFIVTSFIMEPIDLISKLKVNHKEESVFLPAINLDMLTERQKAKLRRGKEKKKAEFLEIFKDYEDSKLIQIVRNKKSYADYAVEAAMEILERRKAIPAAKK